MSADRAELPATVPVLLYHAVTHDPGSHIAAFTVTPEEFARQLDVVQAAGYRCITFGELVDGGAGMPAGKIAVITFDDGYADFASAALPALTARGLPATLFLTSGWLTGRGNREPGPSDPMLAWGQLPELLAAGVELGAHSHSHPQMDTLSARAAREELWRPKDMLEQELGRQVDLFAYPHGYSGPRVRELAPAAGYRAAAGVRNALHRPGVDRYNVARLMVTSTTTGADVASWLDGTGAAPSRDGESLPTRGWRAYRRGRAVLRRAPGSDYR